MERLVTERQIIPPIYDSAFPPELTPGNPTFEYYVSRRVISILEQLVHQETDSFIAEELQIISSEYILLSIEMRSESDAGKEMTAHVYEELLSLFEEENETTKPVVQEKLREYQTIMLKKVSDLEGNAIERTDL
jgi:hypothetical protein